MGSKSSTKYLAKLPLEVAAPIETWSEISRKSGVALYLKGGAVRDVLTNYYHDRRIKIHDLDVFCPNLQYKVLESALSIGGIIISRRLRKNLPRYTLSFPGTKLDTDLGTFMTEAKNYYSLVKNPDINDLIVSDAKYSDFDINTIYLNLSVKESSELLIGNLLDPMSAVESIKKGIFELVSTNSLYLNPATILTAVRLIGKTGFRLGKKSVTTMRIHARLINLLQEDFLEKQLKEILKYTTTDEALYWLGEFGVLKERPKIGIILNTL